MPILHGGNLPNRLKNNPKLSELLFKNAYKNVAPSNYTKSIFESFGLKNCIQIPNSIEIEKYKVVEKEFNKINLLWVRSFSELYNPKLAVSILDELIKKSYATTLTMVGPDNDGSLVQTKAFAKSLNVEVNFTGKLSKQEWIELSKSHNYFINTTNFDNMPVSLIEAMALGFPIITTNVGGIPFLLENNHNAILVVPNNKNTFVQEIIDLHTNTELRQQLITNAIKDSKKYSWELVSKKWQSLLK